MPSPISPISPISIPSPATVSAVTGKAGEFRDALQGAMNHLEQLRTGANDAVQQFLSGETEELHSVALTAQRAELAFELGLQIRNKVVQAYQEIMRMPM